MATAKGVGEDDELGLAPGAKCDGEAALEGDIAGVDDADAPADFDADALLLEDAGGEVDTDAAGVMDLDDVTDADEPLLGDTDVDVPFDRVIDTLALAAARVGDTDTDFTVDGDGLTDAPALPDGVLLGDTLPPLREDVGDADVAIFLDDDAVGLTEVAARWRSAMASPAAGRRWVGVMRAVGMSYKVVVMA